jgi:hypothetical protein
MTETNLRIWDALGKTDPKHTKQFKRTGGFSGTAIKPIWATKQMTELFGPCGAGWGMGKPEFQIVPGANNETLVYCTVALWYRDGDATATVYGVGGDKIVSYQKANTQKGYPESWTSSDEAMKASYTDALSNGFKQIGLGADVHMGMFDDHKYVREMEREFSDDKIASSPPSQKPTASAAAPASAKPTAADNEKFERETVAKIHADIKAATMGDRISEILNDPWIDGYLKSARPKAYDGIITKADERRTALSLHSTGI